MDLDNYCINREKYITWRTRRVPLALGDKADLSSPSRDSITRTRSAVNAIFPRDGNPAIDANDRFSKGEKREETAKEKGIQRKKNAVAPERKVRSSLIIPGNAIDATR